MEGQGIEADLDEAARWFLEASQSGDDEAQHLLALLYLEGRGVDRNLVQAYLWADRAVYNGNDAARTTRDRASEQMSEAQLGEATRLSIEP